MTGLDGNPVPLSLAAINSFYQSVFRQDAVAGFMVGATAMLMILLVLLTNREKARRPIFILNFLALFFLFFRSIVYLVMYCSSYEGIGQIFLGALAQYPRSTFAPQVIQAILTPFIYLTMLFSLVLQVRVVFAAEPRSQEIITVIGSIAALFLFGLGWHQVSILIRAIILLEFVETNWTYDCLRIGIMVFVGVSCLLFLLKLAVAIRRRKRMGFKRFGPLQVLFIIFAQCLVIPRNLLSFRKANFSGCLYTRFHARRFQKSCRLGAMPPHLFPPTILNLGITRIGIRTQTRKYNDYGLRPKSQPLLPILSIPREI